MKFLKFENGDQMPALGLGTWKSKPNEVKNAVIAAVKTGYRHIDCAAIYKNEAEVGEALKQLFDEGIVKREDLWITSKLWNSNHQKEFVEEGLRNTLGDLQLDYLDLYLVHWPVSLKHGVEFPDGPEDFLSPEDVPLHETWSEMEKFHKEGKAKHIGVSNFNRNKISELLKTARISPEMNQVEMHPYLPQNELVDFCKSHNIQLTAYSPLGSRDRSARSDNEPNLFEDDTIVRVAQNHNSTPAQILISWAINRGTSVIPKSTNPERIKQNFEAARLQLTDEEMDSINQVDRQFRFIHGEFWTYEGSPYEQSDLWDYA